MFAHVFPRHIATRAYPNTPDFFRAGHTATSLPQFFYDPHMHAPHTPTHVGDHGSLTALHPCAGVENSPTVTSATLQPWVRVTALHPCAGVDNSPTVTSATLQPWVRVTAAPSAEEKVRLRSTVKEEPDLWSEVFYLAGLCFDLGLGVARTPE